MKKRFGKQLLSIITIGIFTIMALATSKDPTPKISTNVTVEDIKVDKQLKDSWTISGKIKNISDKAVKGIVKIKFINSKGDIVHKHKAMVNDGDSIVPGNTANFKYSAKAKKFDDVVDYKVEFYER